MKKFFSLFVLFVLSGSLFAQQASTSRSAKELKKSAGEFVTVNEHEVLPAHSYTVQISKTKDGGTGTFLKFEDDPQPAASTVLPKPIFSVYPNPALNKTRVSVKNAEQFRVDIFNLIGHRCGFLEADHKTSVEIDLSLYPAGLYLIQCSTGAEISTFKLVKEKE
jgi:hypothetical protein